ncbi:Cna B-type domain-containing protein [Oribacterium parvum]|uniref:Cna B-type domain-containing protein n=1 Tax=Oribacterium parvum TaxID=1501329 RepID=UPI0028EF6286|nr:Cna B-type domain-containing protein [Oribacterium parvum]
MKAKRRIIAFLFSILMIWQGYSFAKAEGEAEMPLFIAESSAENAETVEIEESARENLNSSEELSERETSDSRVASDEFSEFTENGVNVTDAELLSDTNMDVSLLSDDRQEEDTTYTYTAPQGFSKSVRGEVQEIKDDDGNFHYIMEYVVRFDAKSFEGTHNENGYDSVQFVDRLGAGNFGYFMPYSFYSGYSIDGSLYQPVLRRGVWRSGEWKVAQNGKKYFVPAADDANPGSIYSLRSDAEGLKPAEEETIYPDFVHDGKDIPVGFTYNLDHIAPNKGFELRYFVELHEFPEKGSSYNNSAKLVGIDTKEINSTYTVKQNLNTFQGKKHSIKIKKTDKDTGDVLQDAEFILTKKYSNYNMMVTTWYNGEGIIDNLTDGEYEIVEVDPPFGYKLDKTVHSVLIKEEDNKAVYPLDLTNKKINPNTRDIIVEKKWALTVKPGTPSPASLLDDYLSGRLSLFDDSLHGSLLSDTADFDSHDDLSDDRENNSLAASALDVLMDHFTSDTSRVKVYLLVNGEKKEELSAILSDDNDWQHTFEEMPRKGEDGKDIDYSVKEEPVKGYKAAISGTQDTKFTITNYYDEDDSFVIPVTKIWEGKGKRPKEIVVELWGNGSYLDSATLNALNDWQHNFFVLKEKNGKKIEYTVKEVEVEGYTSTIENRLDSGRGFIITNTSNTPPEEENTPEPPKGNDNPPTPGTNENTPPKPNDNGGTPPTPSRGGNTPGNPGGGGSTPPRVVERPPIGVTTPPPAPMNPPENVLGVDRPTPNPAENSPKVHDTNRTPKVLAQGRGWTKTFDSNAIYLYLSFFLLSLTGLAFVVIQRKRNAENKM